jgi:FAD synthetase
MDIEQFLVSISNSTKEDDIDLYKAINDSIIILNNAIEKYDINTIVLSFNGGKDACIILQLYRLLLYRLNKSLSNTRILYFITPNDFKEVDEFMISIKDLYNIDYIRYDCSMKDGMIKEVELGYQCVVIGTRIGDPYTDESTPSFQPSSTDNGWPNFMRINPIIKWTYKQVWYFLRGCKLPYCKLYDEGYTSLGNITNTMKNEALKQIDDDGNITYAPAYMLQDDTLERNTRKK